MSESKINEMFSGTAPTLIVGLGGVGSDIISRVAGQCNDAERKNIRFVAMDTDVNDLKKLVDEGTGIKTVQTSSKMTVGEYLQIDNDARENWFPNNEVLYRKTVSEGAGQVRAISRLALNTTVKTGKMTPLNEALDELYHLTGDSWEQALRVVIVSCAAGGTGSGLALPVAMYIRRLLINNYQQSAALIRGFLLLPEVLWDVVTTDSERNNLRCNAYATVREINAFMMKGSGVCESDKNLARYSSLSLELPHIGTDSNDSLSLLPYDFCFLFDGQNYSGEKLTSLEQYKRHAANCIYAQSIGPTQSRAFSGEDNTIRELCASRGRNRYAGVGTAIVEFPKKSVRDYIAYNWAIDRISNQWTFCDTEYKKEEQRTNEKRMRGEQVDDPVLSDIYISTVDDYSKPEQPNYFQIMVKGSCYNKEGAGTWTHYIRSLTKYIEDGITKHAQLKGVYQNSRTLLQEFDYMDAPGSAESNLEILSEYERKVKENVKKAAFSSANAIFFSDVTLEGNISGEHILEKALKADGGAIHPNAIRYFLYQVFKKFEELHATARIKSEKSFQDLAKYNGEDENMFDLDATKQTEKTIEELAHGDKKDPGMLEKLKKEYKERISKLNTVFPQFCIAIDEYLLNTAKAVVFEVGKSYVSGLIAEMELFYRGLEGKLDTLEDTAKKLVESCANHDGYPYYNVCSSKTHLNYLLENAPKPQGFIKLPNELSAQIFDGFRSNVINKLNSSLDNEVKKTDVDIFEDVLLKYWKEEVEETCGSIIEMNVIDALKKEATINKRVYAEAKLKQPGTDKDTVDMEISEKEQLTHVSNVFAIAKKLSEPFIQKPNGEEPHIIHLCSYNDQLEAKSKVDVNKYLKGTKSKVIGLNKIIFFQSIYGLRVEKLSKFSAEIDGETLKKEAGSYFKAYFDLINQIGPDPATNLVITPHIDKRWNTIAYLPDIDDENQERIVHRINQALVYGLLYKSITYGTLSCDYCDKNFYKLEDMEGEVLEFYVSNGTDCDDFYEVIDALTINPLAVKIIMERADYNYEKMLQKPCEYKETTFAKQVEKFCVSEFHEGKTSLFEIVLMFYLSLPHTMRNEGDVANMIDSIMKLLKEEITRWVSKIDAKYFYCDQLESQFKLFAENAKKFDTLLKGRTLKNDLVVDLIFKKIRRTFKNLEPVNYDERIDEMEALLC